MPVLQGRKPCDHCCFRAARSAGGFSFRYPNDVCKITFAGKGTYVLKRGKTAENTHKVAISNHRIKEVTDQQVRFGYKDYRKGGEKKEMTLSNQEFIRRFSLHILPRRFVRIRHYGILSSSWKRGKLQSLQSDLNIRVPEAKPKTLLNKCRCCKEGNLVTIAIFGQRGPPQDFLFVTQPLSAK